MAKEYRIVKFNDGTYGIEIGKWFWKSYVWLGNCVTSSKSSGNFYDNCRGTLEKCYETIEIIREYEAEKNFKMVSVIETFKI